MLESFEQLKAMIAQVEDDVRKAAGGNKAAGTRVRKQMQEIKNLAQEVRVKVLENRDEEGGAGAGNEGATDRGASDESGNTSGAGGGSQA
jgi:hypothetical protein